MLHCRVAHCRYKTTHVTKGHKCGRCNAYGHGEIECIQTWRRQDLMNYYHEELPNNRACTVEDCPDKWLHTTAAHHCSNCGIRDPHTLADCNGSSSSGSHVPAVASSKTISCPLCRKVSTMTTDPKKILGLSDTCSICLDNNVEILLTGCYHCCICKVCYDAM